MKASDMVKASGYDALIGTPYTTLDCQALVEKLFARAGVKIPNYRGSNHMWREMVHDRDAKEAYKSLGEWEAPVGALCFTIRDDGGEKARGYNDNMKNAAHVGLVISKRGDVIHSTPDKVQYDTLDSTRWTHVALANVLDYDEESEPDPDKLDEILDSLERIEDLLSDLILTIERMNG